jgi:hypothetical protein
MKKLAFAFALILAAFTVAADEHGKGCDMGKGKAVSVTGKISCKGDDCSFLTADQKTTYTVCEMSKPDLAKLSADGKTVTAKGKLIQCEGKEKLLIESAE